MTHLSWRMLIAAVLFSSVACFVWGGSIAASPRSGSAEPELDHLIPREKWDATGLNKLTTPEQQTLANEITGLISTAQSTEIVSSAQKDKSQWRQLHRSMSKDDVKKLLGEPTRVSVSRFYEEWYFPGGTVTFNGKGHLDSWSEL